jgi:hypothetical protein
MLSPSPLEGEGWDEGEFLEISTPHPALSLKGRGLFIPGVQCIFPTCPFRKKFLQIVGSFTKRLI